MRALVAFEENSCFVGGVHVLSHSSAEVTMSRGIQRHWHVEKFGRRGEWLQRRPLDVLGNFKVALAEPGRYYAEKWLKTPFQEDFACALKNETIKGEANHAAAA